MSVNTILSFFRFVNTLLAKRHAQLAAKRAAKEAAINRLVSENMQHAAEQEQALKAAAAISQIIN